MTTTLRRRFATVACLLVASLAAPAPSAVADAGDVGVEGLSFSGTSTPTGSKRAENVLWYNDGSWWGNLWDGASGDFHIYRFEEQGQTWVDTGVPTENRANTHHDVLWDGTTLFVASHRFVKDGAPSQAGYPAKLRRYSYNRDTDTYKLLSTSQINNHRTESLVIDRDTTGRMWATWQQDNKIYLNVTDTTGKTWGTPFTHPDAQVSVDDISALIPFGPGKVGLMWSRQMGDSTDGFYWSVHNDGDPAQTWSAPDAVISGHLSGDDHISLKSLESSGSRVFAAVKTSFTSAAAPQIQLLAMAGGAWTAHTIATVSECPNRVLVLVDEANARLRTFATYPKPAGTTNAGRCTSSGGAIYEKSTALDDINFGSAKTLRILDADQYVHNVSSTKQNLNAARSDGRSTAGSGALVIATVSATNRYWHHYG